MKYYSIVINVQFDIPHAAVTDVIDVMKRLDLYCNTVRYSYQIYLHIGRLYEIVHIHIQIPLTM